MEDKSFEKMSLEDLFSILDKLENQKDAPNIENMVLMIGYTRAGKTTTRLLLQNMENGFEGLVAKNYPLGIHDLNGEIGDKRGNSSTLDPIQFQLPQLNQVVFVDSPGIQDNRGPIEEMKGMYKLNLLANRAKFIKILLFVPFKAFDDDVDKTQRINPLKRAAEFVSRLSSSQGFGIVVTGVDNCIGFDDKQVLEHIKEHLLDPENEVTRELDILDLHSIWQNEKIFLIRRPTKAEKIGGIPYSEYSAFHASSETAHSSGYYAAKCEEFFNFLQRLKYSGRNQPFSVNLSAQTKIDLTGQFYPVMVRRIEENVEKLLNNIKDIIKLQVDSAENQENLALRRKVVFALLEVKTFCSQLKASIELQGQNPSSLLEKLHTNFNSSASEETMQELKTWELRYNKLQAFIQYPDNKLPAKELLTGFGNFLEMLDIKYVAEDMETWIDEKYKLELLNIKTRYQEKFLLYKRLCPKYSKERLATDKHCIDNLCKNQNPGEAVSIESIYDLLGLVVTGTMKTSLEEFYCVAQAESKHCPGSAEHFLADLQGFLAETEAETENEKDSQFDLQTTERQLKTILEVFNQIYNNALTNLDCSLLQERKCLLDRLLNFLEYLPEVTAPVLEIDNQNMEYILERLLSIINKNVENHKIQEALRTQELLKLEDNDTPQTLLSKILKHKSKIELLLFINKIRQFLCGAEPHLVKEAQASVSVELQKESLEEFQSNSSKILEHFSAKLNEFPELSSDLELAIKTQENLAEVRLLKEVIFPDKKTKHRVWNKSLVIEASEYTLSNDQHPDCDFSKFENVFLIITGTLWLNESINIKSKILKNIFISSNKIVSSCENPKIEISAENSDYNPFKLFPLEVNNTLQDDSERIKSMQGPNICMLANKNLTSGSFSVISQGGSYPFPVYKNGDNFDTRVATFDERAKCFASHMGSVQFYDIFVLRKDDAYGLKPLKPDYPVQFVRSYLTQICFYQLEIVVQLLKLAIQFKDDKKCLIDKIAKSCVGSKLYKLTQQISNTLGCCILNCNAVRKRLSNLENGWKSDVWKYIHEQCEIATSEIKKDRKKFWFSIQVDDNKAMHILNFVCNSMAYITFELCRATFEDQTLNSTKSEPIPRISSIIDMCAFGGCPGEVQLFFKECSGNVQTSSLATTVGYSTAKPKCSGKCGQKLKMAAEFYKITEASKDARSIIKAVEDNDDARNFFYNPENNSQEELSEVFDTNSSETNPMLSAENLSQDISAQLNFLKGCYHTKRLASEFHNEPPKMILKLQDYLSACQITITSFKELKIADAISEHQQQFKDSIQGKISQETKATEDAISRHLAGTRSYFSEQMEKLELDMEAIVKLFKQMHKYETACGIVQALDKIIRYSTKLLPKPVSEGTAILSTSVASLAAFFKPEQMDKTPEAMTKEKQNDFKQLIKETEIKIKHQILTLESYIETISNIQMSPKPEQCIKCLKEICTHLREQQEKIGKQQGKNEDNRKRKQEVTVIRSFKNVIRKFRCEPSFDELWLVESADIRMHMFAQLLNLKCQHAKDQQLHDLLLALGWKLSLHCLDDKVYVKKDYSSEAKFPGLFKTPLQSTKVQAAKQRLQSTKENLIPMINQLLDIIENSATFPHWILKDILVESREHFRPYGKGLHCENQFMHIFDKLQTTLDINQNLANKLETLKTTVEVTEYVSDINKIQHFNLTGEMKDSLIKLQLETRSKLLLAEYQQTEKALRQWYFPYEEEAFKAVSEKRERVKELCNRADSKEDFNEAAKLCQNIISHFIETFPKEQAETTTHDKHWTEHKFCDKPLYTWSCEKWAMSIRDLFLGIPTKFVAYITDAENVPVRKSAIKVNKTVDLWFSCRDQADKELQAELDKKMELFTLEMTHSGLSYYTVGKKIYVIRGKETLLRGNVNTTRKDSDEVMNTESRRKTENDSRIKMEDFVMSPYTEWTFKLKLPPDHPNANMIFKELAENFAHCVNVKLVGKGRYLDETGPGWIEPERVDEMPNQDFWWFKSSATRTTMLDV